MTTIIELMLFGIIFGMVSGPIIVFIVGTIIFKFQENSLEKEYRKLHEIHRKNIKKEMKNFNKLRDKYIKEQGILLKTMYTPKKKGGN